MKEAKGFEDLKVPNSNQQKTKKLPMFSDPKQNIFQLKT